MRDKILVKSATDRDPAKSQAFMAHESLGARLKALKMAATDAPDAIDRDQALVSAIVSALVSALVSAIDEAESQVGPAAFVIAALA